MGASPQARSDVRHVAVEFVHPVIVGKRALPAIGLAAEGGSIAAQADLTCEPDDVAIGFDTRRRRWARDCARRRGCVTIAYEPLGRRMGVPRSGRRPLRPPGGRRDALPRALGALPCLLRASRPARRPRGEHRARHRSIAVPLSVPGGVRTGPRRGRRGCAPIGADESRRGERASRADAGGGARRRWARPRRRCGRYSTPERR